jgi:hypothetical protein
VKYKTVLVKRYWINTYCATLQRPIQQSPVQPQVNKKRARKNSDSELYRIITNGHTAPNTVPAYLGTSYQQQQDYKNISPRNPPAYHYPASSTTPTNGSQKWKHEYKTHDYSTNKEAHLKFYYWQHTITFAATNPRPWKHQPQRGPPGSLWDHPSTQLTYGS